MPCEPSSSHYHRITHCGRIIWFQISRLNPSLDRTPSLPGIKGIQTSSNTNFYQVCARNKTVFTSGLTQCRYAPPGPWSLIFPVASANLIREGTGCHPLPPYLGLCITTQWATVEANSSAFTLFRTVASVSRRWDHFVSCPGSALLADKTASLVVHFATLNGHLILLHSPSCMLPGLDDILANPSRPHPFPWPFCKPWKRVPWLNHRTTAPSYCCASCGEKVVGLPGYIATPGAPELLPEEKVVALSHRSAKIVTLFHQNNPLNYAHRLQSWEGPWPNIIRKYISRLLLRFRHYRHQCRPFSSQYTKIILPQHQGWRDTATVDAMNEKPGCAGVQPSWSGTLRKKAVPAETAPFKIIVAM